MGWLERTVHRSVARIARSLIQRRLTAILSALTVSAILAGAAAARPPAGLSSYGRTIWNLEALLHDTFGTRQVYGEWITANRGPLNFTTTFKGECCTSYFLFTFPRARGSAYQLVTLKQPLPASQGASGGEVPVTVRHRFIYCGPAEWLYVHTGDGPLNLQFDCGAPQP